MKTFIILLLFVNTLNMNAQNKSLNFYAKDKLYCFNIEDYVEITFPSGGNTNSDGLFIVCSDTTYSFLLGNIEKIKFVQTSDTYISVKHSFNQHASINIASIQKMYFSKFSNTNVDEPEYKMKIYPNPVSDKLHIDIPLTHNINLINIFDQFGKLVRTITNERMSPYENQLEWDMLNTKGERVGNGLYILQISTNYLTISSTFVVLPK